MRQKFTSKERDAETGLDYFLARYYSSTQGRFTSPDEFSGGPDELFYFVKDASANPTFYADLTKPQSLNKYQYAYNNPLRYIDPDGHEIDDPDSCCDGQSVPVPVPGPPLALTPDQQRDVINTFNAVNGLIDRAVQPVRDLGIVVSIRQLIGTESEPVVAPIPVPQAAPLPLPQAQSQPRTGTPPSQQAQPVPPPAPMKAKGGKQNKRDSGLANKTDKQIREGARDKSLPPRERRRYQTEEKAIDFKKNNLTGLTRLTGSIRKQVPKTDGCSVLPLIRPVNPVHFFFLNAIENKETRIRGSSNEIDGGK